MVASDYFRGIGIGLLIAWVTGLIAYIRNKNPSTFLYVLILEMVLSIIFLTISFIMRE